MQQYANKKFFGILFAMFCFSMLINSSAYALSEEECSESIEKIRSGEISREEAEKIMAECGSPSFNGERQVGKCPGDNCPVGVPPVGKCPGSNCPEIERENDLSQKHHEEHKKSPRQQMKDGVKASEVSCNENKVLMIKTSTEKALCISSTSVGKLLERGIIHLP